MPDRWVDVKDTKKRRMPSFMRPLGRCYKGNVFSNIPVVVLDRIIEFVSNKCSMHNIHTLSMASRELRNCVDNAESIWRICRICQTRELGIGSAPMTCDDCGAWGCSDCVKRGKGAVLCAHSSMSSIEESYVRCIMCSLSALGECNVCGTTLCPLCEVHSGGDVCTLCFLSM